MRLLSALFLALGVAALAVMVIHIGPRALADGVLRAGWGLPLACGFHLVMLVLDALMLKLLCGEAGAGIGVFAMTRVMVAAHGINLATPFSQLGEVTRYDLLRDRVPRERLVAAILRLNIVWFVVACALVAVIPPAATLILPMPPALATGLYASAALFALIGLGLLVVLRTGIGEWPWRLLARLPIARARAERARAGWQRIEQLARTGLGPRREAAVWVLSLLSRLAAFSETAVLLYFLGAEHALALALLSAVITMVVGWVTSFVPMQAGTAEGGSFLLFGAVGSSPAAGVALELTRKLVRVVFVGLGVVVLGAHAFRRYLKARGAPAPAAAADPALAPPP